MSTARHDLACCVREGEHEGVLPQLFEQTRSLCLSHCLTEGKFPGPSQNLSKVETMRKVFQFNSNILRRKKAIGFCLDSLFSDVVSDSPQ